MSEVNVEKRLKNPYFKPFDTSVACVLFIVFQLILSIFILMLGNGALNNGFLNFLFNILIEAVFVLAVWVSSRIGKVDFIEATTLNKKPNYIHILIGIVISLVTLFAFSSLTNVFMITIEKLGYTPVDDIVISSFGMYVSYFITSCIVPAFCEEMLFRGCILNGLKGINAHFAVFASAFIFAIMHGLPDQTIHQFILGIVLGYLFVYTGSIFVPMFVHFFNNFIAITIGYIQGAVEAVDVSLIKWNEVLTGLLFALLLAAVGALILVYCFKLIKKTAKKNSVAPSLEENETMAKTLDKSKNKYSGSLVFIFYAFTLAYLIFEWVSALITRL